MEKSVTLRSASFISQFQQDFPLVSASLISCAHLRPSNTVTCGNEIRGTEGMERRVEARKAKQETEVGHQVQVTKDLVDHIKELDLIQKVMGVL